MLSLADAILQENMDSVRDLLRNGADVNQMDEYGFTPLIEAAIMDHVDMTKLLLDYGADPHQQDVTGGTALHWAAENNNSVLSQCLLEHGANPNAYNFAGQPVLVMPALRHQTALRQLLIRAGADEIFAQDYINTKLLGHLFELVGTATIVDPKHRFIEVDFEGFYIEVTMGLIADSLAQFQNHFAARQLRRYSGLAHFIVEVMRRTSQLIRYQQYRMDVAPHHAKIDHLLHQEPWLIPVGYEGHAITFIRYGDIWVKCDRREESRLYDNIMFYQVGHPEQLTLDFARRLLYEKSSDEFINHELDHLLALQPLTELKVEAQLSGNCSWANIEAVIPALFFLVLMQMNKDTEAIAYYKTLALNFYHRWLEWNKERALQFCIKNYEQSDSIRKACKAEILAAILFQRCEARHVSDRARIRSILNLLAHSPYDYILKNYLRVYYYEGYTEEGKRFFELLKEYDYLN